MTKLGFVARVFLAGFTITLHAAAQEEAPKIPVDTQLTLEAAPPVQKPLIHSVLYLRCKKTNMKGTAFVVSGGMVVTGQGQEQSHNGFGWIDSSEKYKLGFASGYAMAMTNVYDRGTFKCLAEKGEEAMKACAQTEVIPFDFTQIRLGQLAEGVDDFYKHFRNKGIDINLAVRYVRDELKGKSAKELQDELAKWRNPVR